jgi:plastocyanin
MTRRRGLGLAVLIASLCLPARQSSAYEAITVSDGGTIKGKVVYTAAPPAARKIVHTKDHEVCGSGVRDVDQITIASDKVVQDAVVYLKNVGRGKAWPSPNTTVVVRNHACEFTPYVQVVPVGAPVDLVNGDPVFHNMQAFRDKSSLFNLGLIKNSKKVWQGFDQPGIVRLECSAHGWMRGWLYVTDSPYYAITPKDGTFTIGDVPPGHYTLVAWHSFSGATETPVTVTAKNTMTLTPDLARR